MIERNINLIIEDTIKHNVRVINSYFCTKYCKDKLLTYLLLKENGIEHPYTEQLERYDYNDYKQKFGEAFIIKNKFGSQGIGVYLITKEEEYDRLIKTIETKDFIIQKYISESYGNDVRAYVIGNQVIGAVLSDYYWLFELLYIFCTILQMKIMHLD